MNDRERERERKSEKRERERPFLLVFVTVLHRFREENSNVYTSLSIGFNVYNMPLLRMREDLCKIYSHRIYFCVAFFKARAMESLKAYIV